MSILISLIKKVDGFMIFFSMSLLVIMVIVIFMQVILRYIFNNPTSWSEEFSMLALVWFGYISVSMGFGRSYHIALEIFTDWLPTTIKRILAIISDISATVVGVMMVHYGFVLSKKVAIQVMPAMGFSKSWLYYSLVISGFILIMYALTHLFNPNFFSEEDKRYEL